MTEQDLAATSADAFARLAIELHDAPGVEETVDAVVQFALQALSCTYAGVALYTRGSQPEIAAVTDPVVADVYDLQISSQNGPLVTALRDRTTILIRDTTTDDRWPEWAAKVAALGVRSVLDVPLATGDAARATVGVLGLYSPPAGRVQPRTTRRSPTSSPGTPPSRSPPPGTRRRWPRPSTPASSSARRWAS